MREREREKKKDHAKEMEDVSAEASTFGPCYCPYVIWSEQEQDLHSTPLSTERASACLGGEGPCPEHE